MHSHGRISATLVGLLGGGDGGFKQVAGCHMVALALLQAYVTSQLGHIGGEHSQAGHTHIDPDVGLRRASDRLLAEEEEVAGKELQLRLASPAFQDHLQRERWLFHLFFLSYIPSRPGLGFNLRQGKSHLHRLFSLC